MGSPMSIPLFLLIVIALFFLPLNYGQSANASSEGDPALLYALLQVVTGVIGIVAGIIFTLYLYLHDQKRQKIETLRRTYQPLLWELKDNRKELSDENNKISYTLSQDGAMKKIRYSNVYFYEESYRSTLNSGLFSYLPENAQYELASLYSRIKSHNELLSYIDELQDNIMLSSEELDREKKLFKIRERYDFILTQWESEMEKLLPSVEGHIAEARKEPIHSGRFHKFYRSFLGFYAKSE
jgi:hypothetical protein